MLPLPNTKSNFSERDCPQTSGEQDPDLESNPAGYLDFVGFGLDWISFPFQPDPYSDYPNEKICGHAKNLDME